MSKTSEQFSRENEQLHFTMLVERSFQTVVYI